jgi:EAL domain-containing protein (putative c-di-GMP-specific phosphodiesterase class I)
VKWRSTNRVGAYVSVNLSPIQLENDQFASVVSGILLKHGLEPSALMLEVTEGALLVERSRESLRELRSHGVRVAIDDFGTGYSSLSHLRHLPAYIVKIDQSFLRPLGDTSADPVLLRAIIRLAETLQLATICEGIETLGQLSDLRSSGCGFGQGYLLTRPGPLADVPAAIAVLDRSPGRPSFNRDELAAGAVPWASLGVA